MMLRCGHRDKLPDAFIESAVDYQIGTCAEGGTYAFIVESFSESCGSIEIDLGFLIGHV